MARAREALEKKAQRAIIQEAFLRWESAVVISLTLILALFGGNVVDFIPWWGWAAGGAVAEIGLVVSSMLDPAFGQKVVANLLRQEFKPERLQDKRLQQQINEAIDYHIRIDKAIRGQDNTLLYDELAEAAVQIDEWLRNMYDLARRIDRHQEEQQILERDKKRTHARVSQLNQQLEGETNTAVRQQIEATLESMQRQLRTLDALDDTIQRARLQLENSLVHLGTIYSQTMLVDVKDIDSGRAKRLRQEIKEEVVEINDLLLAMDEVYTSENAT